MPSSTSDDLLPTTYINLLRAQDQLQAGFSALFRQHGLTASQYNVLRIVRGSGKQGATCRHIGDELITRVPDVTRLVDRMEKAGLVTRRRGEADRRVVRVHLSPAGKRLCDKLDEPVLKCHREQFAHVDRKTLEALDRGLRRVLDAPRA